MPEKRMQRLNGLDASFLAQERGSSHMHIGGVLIFEGPAPDIDTVRDHVASRLHLIPRYRQKLAIPRFEAGRPFWIDDPRFNINYHVRDSALPAPGSDEQLQQLIARMFSQRLDRAKPLWELWIVHGLKDGRFALISKTHHSVVDGIAGIDITTVLLDAEREPSSTIEPPEEPWKPAPEPSQAEMIAEGVKDFASLPLSIAERAVKAIEQPGSTIERVREAIEAVGEVARETLDPAPVTPLNLAIGSHRRYKLVRASLADFKEIKDTLGGTVNDVVLTVVADGLGRWLRNRGFPTVELELRGLVPVSTRSNRDLGNQIAVMRGPLPVDDIDPVARFTRVRSAMNGLKDSKQALGAEVIAGAQNFAPPTILAQASRINFSTRLFNLLVTNVPGPQFALYLLGRRALEAAPIPFLAERHALAIAIVSYDGQLNFGLLGDYDAMPDIAFLRDGIAESIDELLEIARAEQLRQLRPLNHRRRTRSKRRQIRAV